MWKAVDAVEKNVDIMKEEVCGPYGDDDYRVYEHDEYIYVVRNFMLS